jgi:hypothetical protein
VTSKAILFGFLPVLLLSCAPNPDVERLHGKLLRLRGLMEHATTMEELWRLRVGSEEAAEHKAGNAVK